MVVLSAKRFRCSVITPEGVVFEGEATFVALPAHDGEIGVMHDRAPLLCELGIGTLRLHAEAGLRRFFIDGGFARVLDNELIVLTRQALEPEQIRRDDAEQALRQALAMRIRDEASLHARRDAIARARAQLKLASSEPDRPAGRA